MTALLLLMACAVPPQAPLPPQAPPEIAGCADPACACGCRAGRPCHCEEHARWRAEGWAPGRRDPRWWYQVGPAAARAGDYDDAPPPPPRAFPAFAPVTYAAPQYAAPAWSGGGVRGGC